MGRAASGNEFDPIVDMSHCLQSAIYKLAGCSSLVLIFSLLKLELVHCMATCLMGCE